MTLSQVLVYTGCCVWLHLLAGRQASPEGHYPCCILSSVFPLLNNFASNSTYLPLLWCFQFNIAKDLLLFSATYGITLGHTRYYCKILVRWKTASNLQSCTVGLDSQTVQMYPHDRLEVCWITLQVGKWCNSLWTQLCCSKFPWWCGFLICSQTFWSCCFF